MKDGSVATYDAILVDEGQNFNLEWWNLLRRVVRPSGEMWLAADQTQDIYHRSQNWTDQKMAHAGFKGPWHRLNLSHRTPPDLIPHLQRFVRIFLDPTASDPLTAKQPGLNGLYALREQWWQIGRQDDAAMACVKAVLEMPCFADPQTIAFSDVVLLVETQEFGLRCVELLGESGVRVVHTFGKDQLESRRSKRGFYAGGSCIKASTIHSFQGWDSPSLVVFIGRANDDDSLRLAYVGLSRLRERMEGSYLTAVCAAPELEQFGRSTSNFQDRIGTFVPVLVHSYHIEDVPF